MPLLKTLSRTLRARDDDSASDPYSDELEGSSPSVLDTGEGGEHDDTDTGSDLPGDEEESDDELSGSEDARERAKQQLSEISFGTLAKVQDTLAQEGYTGRKRKRGAGASAEQEGKLQALRERLREIKAGKGISTAKAGNPGAGTTRATKPAPRRRDAASGSDGGSAPSASGSGQDSDDDDDDDDDDDSQDAPAKKPARSSKHAPAIQSSKRAVTRKRGVVAVPARKARDPRFEPLPGSSRAAAAAGAGKHYAFLDAYRASEMAELRAAVRRTADAAQREALQRKLLSMESRRKADRAKEERAEVVREHRRREREAVGQGKRPFFLKRSEVKKRVLVERFGGMKGREREKAVERRRKKVAARERKGMPGARRGVDA